MSFVAIVNTPHSSQVDVFGPFESRELAQAFVDRLADCDYQRGDHIYSVERVAAPTEVLSDWRKQ